MKKSLIAVAALAAVAGAANAESSVTLYGIADVGVATLTNAGNFNCNFVTCAVPTGGFNGGTATGMMNGGQSASRWGLMGKEDLGGGNTAFFKLESGINFGNGSVANSNLGNGPLNGNMGADTSLQGQLFGRAAYVGIGNNQLGSLTLGRMNSLQLDIISQYDPVNAQMFSPINFSGSYGGGGATDNARVDNAIKYSNKFGNFNVNGLYSLGGVAGNLQARTNLQLNVGYEAGPFGIQLAGQKAKDTTSLTPGLTAGTINAKFVDLNSYMAALKYKVTEPLTLLAGYERLEISAPSDYAVDQSISVYGYQTNAQAWNAPTKKVNVYWLGANYQLTPAIKLSGAFYSANQLGYGTGTAAPGADNYYSLMAEYAFSKRTNLYAAMMLDRKDSALVSGVAPTGFNTYGVGIRHKF